MITSAHRPGRPVTTELAQAETHGMSAGHPFAVDSYTLLDHRTRNRTIPAEDAPPGRYLSLQDGDAHRLLALERPITHVGRGLVADVRLEDAHVSRRHAIVAMRGDGVRVLDDRSANGTFVNGRAVTTAELADGDVLRVGRAVFRYVEVRRPREHAARRTPSADRRRHGPGVHARIRARDLRPS